MWRGSSAPNRALKQCVKQSGLAAKRCSLQHLQGASRARVVISCQVSKERSVDTIGNIVTGVLSAVLVMIFVERARRPYLKFVVEPTVSAGDRSHVRIIVKNPPMGKPLGWIYDREPAFRCYAWIKFYFEDGTEVYPQEMIARWARTPEPRIDRHESGEPKIQNPYELSNWVDISARMEEPLDVAMRESGAIVCYGWSNESYPTPSDNWRLLQGRYIVRVRVMTGGRDVYGYFRLINDSDFRLEPFDDNNVIRKLK